VVDHVRDLIDEYSQGRERDSFFAAAGVDGELTEKEFAEAAGKENSFVRSYDRWAAAVAFDADGNGKLNWAEAEKYRLHVRNRVLSLFDKDKDGRLKGPERAAANAYLARGVRPAGVAGIWRGTGPRGYYKRYDLDGDGKLDEAERKAMRKDWRKRAEQARRRYHLRLYDRNKDGKLDAEERAAMEKAQAERRARYEKYRREMLEKWDTDGDGRLSREERRAMYKAYRAEHRKKRLEKWDANGDGKIDEQERQAEAEHYRKLARERFRKWLERRHDVNGDGQLDEQERAAAEAELEKWRRRREQWRQRVAEWKKRWDTDGDGELSEQERKAMYEAIRAEAERRRRAMDLDGDGKVSGEEARQYWQKLRDKYDADGDGTLSPEERRKMFQEEFRSVAPAGVSIIGGPGGRMGAMIPIPTGPGETTYTSEDGSVRVVVRRSPPPEED